MVDFSGYSELIDKYLAGGMNEKERNNFEQQLSTSPELQKMVNDTKLIRKAVIAVERERILNKVQKVAEEFRDNTNEEVKIPAGKTRKLFIRKWSIAASILIVVSLGIVTLLKDSHISYLSDYIPFTGYREIPIPRLRGDNSPQKLNDAWELYNSGQYDKSFQIINKAKPSEFYMSEYSFLRGLCLIQKKKYLEAAESLELAANSSFRYSEEAKWYLGLTYLEVGNKEDAKKMLLQIIKPNEHVIKVLKEIDQ